MYVWHGSSKKFKITRPSPTKRSHQKNGLRIIDYEGTSLHVAKHRWIALAYTNTRKFFKHKGKRHRFSTSVNLYKNRKIVFVHGKRSMKYSLERMFHNGVYLYTFDKKKFKSVKGLGDM